MTLLGYSWGAMLSIAFAAQYPESIKELILVSCPPLEARFAQEIMKKRMTRLNPIDRAQFQEAEARLKRAKGVEKIQLLGNLKELFDKMDNLHPLPDEDPNTLTMRPDIFEATWPEAARLREEGYFINCARTLLCSTVFFHGDYDPHPLEAVKDACRFIPKSSLVLLKECGHTPWRERYVKEDFYKKLQESLL